MTERWDLRMRRMFRGATSLVVLMAALAPAPSIADHERPRYESPHSLTRMAGKLFFVARDRAHGIELWKTAGTDRSTRIVKDIRTGLENYGEEQPETVSQLTRWKGDLYFTRNVFDDYEELWKSDGTKRGTHIVKDLPGGDALQPSYLTIFDDSLYFIGTSESERSGNPEDQLWKTDGTERGTVMVSDPDGSNMDHLVRVGESLFFATKQWDTRAEAIWSSDGTASGTQPVHTVIPGTAATPSCALIGFLYEAGGLLYFPVAEGPPTDGFNDCNEDLWRSDGTSAGTFKLRDFDLPQWGSHRVYEMNGEAITVGNDPEHSRELWKSDGTPEGTKMIRDINPGPRPSQVSGVAHGHWSFDPVLEEHLYFDANDGEHGLEVWSTDASEDGTKLVADIRPGPKGSHPHNFVAVESRGLVFFMADDGRHGFELWKTDGTAAGTSMVKDVNPDGDGVIREDFGTDLTRLRSKLYFLATDGVHPLELWRTDGTRRGTKRVAHL